MQYDVSQIKIAMRPCVVGLPIDAYVEYFGSAAGFSFIIFRPRDEWDYKDFVCVMGDKLLPIIQVTRYRDGGTTIAKTEKGEFFFPSPFGSDQPPASFNGQPIEIF